MESIPLARKKWPLLVACCAAVGLELLLFLAVTRHAVAAWLGGIALEGDWGWVSISGWHALIAFAGLMLCRQPLAELRTVFTREGIIRPRLFGPPVHICWEEAESVHVAPLANRPYLVRVNAPGRSIEINALYYERPAELMELIEERMSAYTPARGHSRLAAR